MKMIYKDKGLSSMLNRLSILLSLLIPILLLSNNNVLLSLSTKKRLRINSFLYTSLTKSKSSNKSKNIAVSLIMFFVRCLETVKKYMNAKQKKRINLTLEIERFYLYDPVYTDYISINSLPRLVLVPHNYPYKYLVSYHQL